MSHIQSEWAHRKKESRKEKEKGGEEKEDTPFRTKAQYNAGESRPPALGGGGLGHTHPPSIYIIYPQRVCSGNPTDLDAKLGNPTGNPNFRKPV